MKTIKRAIHIDFHTLPGIEDFGANFDAREFAQTLKNARVEFINAFAKCNIGFAYYPTEIGLTYPGLSFDMFGQIVEECRKVGISVIAYFNVGLDHEMARKRREWTIVNKEGQMIYGDRTANFFRVMCLNTPYRQYVFGMIKEVLERYPVEGVFLDCLAIRPCYCNDCNESMQKQGLDPTNDEHVYAFAQSMMLDFARQVKSLIGDDKYLTLNGLAPNFTEGLHTHAEIECLPSAWSYDFFPARAAYLRNTEDQVIYMTGRFHVNWGDFGGIKSKASLLNDCWDAISNAATTSIGDHMHPRDGLDRSMYRMIGEIYREIEQYEPWTDDAKAKADIAVLAKKAAGIEKAHNGAARMLGELKYTYDITDERNDLSKYKVVILPDNIEVDAALKSKLEAHISSGGGIISTGRSGLNPEGTAFAIDSWNMIYEGEDPWNSSYFKARADLGEEVPDSLCGIYSQAILMQAKEGATVVADYYEPYFNRHWDGFHGYFYTPPKGDAGRPAVARSGNIFQFCFNLFGAYMDVAMPTHKYLLNYVLQQLLDAPLIRCEQIPTYARVTVTEKENMRMIHVKTTHPEPRGRYNIIEDLPILTDGVVYVRADAAVKQAYLAPERKPLAYEMQDGYIRIPLPKLRGYGMVVVEWEHSKI